MDNPWFGSLITAAISGFVAITVVFIAGWLQSKRERHTARTATYTPSPPTTQEVWVRLDRVERVMRSSVALLGEVAEQWPHDHVPVLSKRHVSVLQSEGYMPPEWDPPVE